MKNKNISVVVMKIVLCVFSATAMAQEGEGNSQNEPVEIEEGIGHLKKHCKCEYNIGVPYVERRATFGGTFGIQWGTFTPSNYRPNYSSSTFDAYYGPQKNSSIEVEFGMQWNFTLGSIGPNVTFGYFSSTNGTASVAMYPITAGLTFALNTLFKEPYVVPYVTGGMYTVIFSETQQGLSTSGSGAFAPFYSAGAMFQLDWMDSEAHDSAYREFGLENTFLYVEGRSFLVAPVTASASIPDFSTPLQIYAGIKTEF